MASALEGSLEPDSSAGLPPCEIPAPDHKLLGVIDKVSFERALKKLPLGYRIVFVLHDIEGYEHREIAEMVACSVGNSKSQLHRARLRLRKLLAQYSHRRAWAGALRAGEVPAVSRSMPADVWVAA